MRMFISLNMQPHIVGYYPTFGAQIHAPSVCGGNCSRGFFFVAVGGVVMGKIAAIKTAPNYSEYGICS